MVWEVYRRIEQYFFLGRLLRLHYEKIYNSQNVLMDEDRYERHQIHNGLRLVQATYQSIKFDFLYLLMSDEFQARASSRNF